MTQSPLASASATRQLLEEFGLATKHRLGQNFLIDNHVIERICNLAELDGNELVLEVGPGIGTLTLALTQEASRVVSIEADSELEPVLASHEYDTDNFRFIMGDALKVTPEQIAQVADRIAAVPGNRTYGGYTAKLGLYGTVTGRFEVPPRCFMPAPHVDSAVVRIDRVDMALPDGLGEEQVARVIDAAFAQRRKTIRNSMSANGFEKDVLDAAFAAAGIEPTTRAEMLATPDFIALAQELERVR